MKLLRIHDGNFEFDLAREERDLLFHLLGLYPVVPATHHRLTRDGKPSNQKENQELLDEAMQSQRRANKKEIIALLDEAGRFTDVGKNCRVIFARGELEWLLQVLNDVRVGSWLALGSPGQKQERRLRGDAVSVRYLMQMELAGGFEMYLLGAVNGTLKPEPEEG
jgi:hypothetical protein